LDCAQLLQKAGQVRRRRNTEYTRSSDHGRCAQHEQGVARTSNNRVCASIVAAELDKRGCVVKILDDRTDLATDEPVLRQIADKRDRA
jgi:hypothetical protein